jgi:hypothetical protein
MAAPYLWPHCGDRAKAQRGGVLGHGCEVGTPNVA